MLLSSYICISLSTGGRDPNILQLAGLEVFLDFRHIPVTEQFFFHDHFGAPIQTFSFLSVSTYYRLLVPFPPLTWLRISVCERILVELNVKRKWEVKVSVSRPGITLDPAHICIHFPQLCIPRGIGHSLCQVTKYHVASSSHLLYIYIVKRDPSWTRSGPLKDRTALTLQLLNRH